MYYKFEKKGFSLAEVLITLGIIGVVAAITLPSLLYNCRFITTRTIFKKHLSELNQMVKLSIADGGVDFANAKSATTSVKTDGSVSMCKKATLNDFSFCGIFNHGLRNVEMLDTLGHYAYYNVKNLNTTWGNWRYLFPDGTIVGFSGAHNHRDCTLGVGETINREWFDLHYGCFGFIDVNGNSGPNKEILCSDNVETVITTENPCVVRPGTLDDIIPIVYHDGVVEPATNAAIYILRK